MVIAVEVVQLIQITSGIEATQAPEIETPATDCNKVQTHPIKVDMAAPETPEH